ncbi:hypothetical protein [Alteromonas sp. RKMC-009]|uniref:hypothetical protein n=1 Tax=Alteromonas sp. RKMC-009 TaxID=2267264 RepID=UPI000E690B78|nr:hypothetical protein [Alteromonas sp. RKMC-009]AYA64313.1 hypothetical protein DS731_10060 [Alteromonas sp. RKMC-009]
MLLNTNNQEITLVGGTYVVGADLAGGTLDLQFQYERGTKWYSVGELEDGKGQLVEIPGFKSKVRIVKTGSASLELAQAM